MTMAGTSDPIEMLTVSDENIAVEEQLSRKNGGWVISFTLASKRDHPIAVRISVPMPDEPTRQDVGFHPRHEPQTWGIRNGVLTFEDTVPSDEPLQILLGIVLVEDDEVTLSLSEPTIELSQPAESADEEEFLSKDSPIFRSNSIGVADDAEEAVTSDAERAENEILERHQQDESPAAVDDSDAGAQPESAGESGDESSLEETFDLEHLRGVSEEIEAESSNVETDETGAGGDSGSDASDDEVFEDFQSATGDQSEPGADTSVETPSSTDQTTTVERDDDILSKLVEQLESSDPEDDELEALREHLVPESRKSAHVRMEHIQSRMDDLAAYTDALEGLINKHGTASEFMTQIEDELDEISSGLEAVRSETTVADDERQEIRNRLSDMETSVDEIDDDLRARLDNLYEELDSIQNSVDTQDEKVQNLQEAVYDHDEELEKLDDRIRSTDDKLENHRDALDQRLSTLSNQMEQIQDTLESDFSRLRDEVESLSEMRSVFARAFAEQDLDDEMKDADIPESEDPLDEGDEAE